MSDEYSDEFEEDEEEEEEPDENSDDAAMREALESGEYREARTGDGKVYWYHSQTKEPTWDLRRTLAGKKGEAEEEAAISIDIGSSSLLRRREERRKPHTNAQEASTPSVSPIKPEPREEAKTPALHTVIPDSSDFSDVSQSLNQFSGTCATVIPNILQADDSTIEQPSNTNIIPADSAATPKTNKERKHIEEQRVEEQPSSTAASSDKDVEASRRLAEADSILISSSKSKASPVGRAESFKFNVPELPSVSIGEILRPTMLIEEQQRLERESAGYRAADCKPFGAESRINREIEDGILDMVLLLCLEKQGHVPASFLDTVKKSRRMAGWEENRRMPEHLVEDGRGYKPDVRIVQKKSKRVPAVPPGGWGFDIDPDLFSEKGALGEMVTANLEKFVLRHLTISSPPVGFREGQAELVIINDVVTVLLQVLSNQGSLNYPTATYLVKVVKPESVLSPLVSSIMHCMPFESVVNSDNMYRLEYWVTRDHVLDCITSLHRMSRSITATVSNRLKPLADPGRSRVPPDIDTFTYYDDGTPLMQLIIERSSEDQVQAAAPTVAVHSATLEQLSHEVKVEAFARTGFHPPAARIDAFLTHTVHEVLTDDVVKRVVTDQVLKKLGIKGKGKRRAGT
eukprot:TRINITY_DN29449_c0_g1_i1.p1 TRINITY_DN29449_c0_g1~~TRINITY_DN29449_c0_g1_i1.p1  ORF type:complete len:629 (+),score=90.50 TRINITY_DN29449_c0_g1_i1:71-1957(+)